MLVHGRLQRATSLPVAARRRPRRRRRPVQLVRPGRRLLARAVRRPPPPSQSQLQPHPPSSSSSSPTATTAAHPPSVQTPRPVPVVRPQRNHHASSVRGKYLRSPLVTHTHAHEACPNTRFLPRIFPTVLNADLNSKSLFFLILLIF